MHSILKGLAALGLVLAAGAAGAQEHAAEGDHAEGGTPHYPLVAPVEQDWSFAGPFGTYDIGQLQRGLKVYRESCAACHSMRLVPFRSLEALGYNEAQVRTIAAEYTIVDGPNASGDMFERPGVPSDRFPSPFPNAEAAASANNGAAPPDFSLIAKARTVTRGFPTFVFDIFTQYAEGGPDYIYGLLTGYTEAPASFELQPGTHYNPHFINGAAFSMPPPLQNDQIEYDDDTPRTVDNYARDVAAFLMWAAEPHLEARKKTGFVVMIFLVLFSGLVYLTKRKIWGAVAH
ncbi:MAG: cytochrome c1 [Rhizobiaceae bacterium]|nr:cytochrome c1 [Rhizobiaceae bacterium]